MSRMATNEWTSTEHALRYLSCADPPHRTEGEGVLLDHVPAATRRILDLGTGDGRLLALLRTESACVGLDVSEPMLAVARERFAGDERVALLPHDFAARLPDLGTFDAIVSCLAIHHVEDERKRSLYGEVFARLKPGGVFANLEHVASPTERLHRRFYEALGPGWDWEDPSDRLLDVETQLAWLRELGFADVDCYWKWL